MSVFSEEKWFWIRVDVIGGFILDFLFIFFGEIFYDIRSYKIYFVFGMVDIVLLKILYFLFFVLCFFIVCVSCFCFIIYMLEYNSIIIEVYMFMGNIYILCGIILCINI